jgi:glycosyltransferase involved in cell wall biosynthesis
VLRSNVCIAVPTFRRPQLLRELLVSLCRQEGVTEHRVEIVVFDNDRAGTAREVVSGFEFEAPVPLYYVKVDEPGLSMVRNAALAFARERFEFLAMIDDDETAGRRWLLELLRVQQATGADAVFGRVDRDLPADAPRWIRAGKFLKAPTFADGAPIIHGSTSNCLLKLTSPAAAGLQFDVRLNEAGGEDELFFGQLRLGGGRLVYAAQAIVHDRVQPQRLSARYILFRSFRNGNTAWFCDARMYGTLSVMVIRIAKALAKIGSGIVGLIPRGLARGRTGLVEALQDVARGAGTLAGLCGVLVLEYGRSAKDEASR